MNCPHCDHPESRVTETRASTEYDKRIRQCRSCGRTFTTLERVAVFGGRAIGYIEAGGPVVIEPDEEPERVKRGNDRRYVAMDDDPDLLTCAAGAQPLLLEWWNNSRWSKQKSKAAWTEAAWKGALKRVAVLPFWQQIALAQAGVESGWQTLKPEFISDQAPPPEAGLAPKSSAYARAIESWNNRPA